MKTETIPAVKGAQGLIKKGLQKHLEKIPGAININEQEQLTYEGRFCLKSKNYQPCCARAPWFGPGLSGVYSRLNSNISHNNIHNNNKLYFSRVALDSTKY